MPVTCTNQPRVLRVVYTAFEDEYSKREVVCYMEPDQNGQIDIFYSHHTDYERPDYKGPWGVPHNFTLELSAFLISEISANVMYQFWPTFGMKVRALPKGKSLPYVEKELNGDIKFR